MPLIAQLIAAVLLVVVGFLLLGSIKKPNQEIKDLENPTADAGRELPVVFGTVTVKGVNILWFDEKNTITKEV